MFRQRRPKYTGVLNEPMIQYFGAAPGGRRGLLPPLSKEEAEQKNSHQISMRVEALRSHYKLASDAPMLDLLCLLAKDHVRGFTYAVPRKERKDKVLYSNDLELFKQIEGLTGGKKGKYYGAFLKVAKAQLPAAASLEERQSRAKTLSRRYYALLKNTPAERLRRLKQVSGT